MSLSLLSSSPVSTWSQITARNRKASSHLGSDLYNSTHFSSEAAAVWCCKIAMILGGPEK